MRIRNPNPLFLALSLSALIHGLCLVSAGSRPVLPDKDRAVMVNILPAALPPERTPAVVLPETPRAEIPPTVTENAAPAEEAAPTEEAVAPPAENAIFSAETLRAESSFRLSSEQQESSPVSPSFVRPAIREDAIARYAAMIHDLIDRRKTYPYQARRQDQHGTVQLRFTLSRRGVLKGDPVMEKSSRYRLLNESALEAVKNAAPYPPFPEEIPEQEMSFQVTVSFSLGMP
jgi:protein TonB